MRSAASGERGALRGYRWQYDHIAALVYDAVVDDHFEALRLADPEAATVDDLVLLRRGRVDGFQFKSAETDGYITLGQLLRPRRNRSGGRVPSLFRSLADGWIALRKRWANAEVHLVASQFPSPNDHLTSRETPHRPTPDHTQAFLGQVLTPLTARVAVVDDISSGWADRESDVTTRLEEIAELVGIHADDGCIDEARRLALDLIPMAFGVGYRKDYQFTGWVDWLARAMRERPSSDLTDDAVWLAKLLIAAEPMTEGAPRSAAQHLPAAVVPGSPLAALRIFEYLVRSGTVDHLGAMASLVAELANHVSDGASIWLSADLTSELIAPAANAAYPEAAAAVMQTALSRGTADPDKLAEAIVARTDYYALPTLRAGWRRAVGPGSDDEQSSDRHGSHDDYGALVLNDGRRIPRGDVPVQTTDASSIEALRQAELPESNFDWGRLIESAPLSHDDVERLAVSFEDGSRRAADALVALAERAFRDGDKELARKLAMKALSSASDDSWSTWLHGATRRRAYALAIRAGEHGARRDACSDLAEQIMTSPWFAGTLTVDLDEVVDAVYPCTSAAEVWLEIRTHLDGIAESLAVSDDDVLGARPVRWWLEGQDVEQRVRASEDRPEVALAELAVGHLSHATWLLRGAATRIVTWALGRADDHVAQALARFAMAEAADDVLEAAGRCLAAVRTAPGYTLPKCLQDLEQSLLGHRSQVIRDLAATRRTTPRPLSPVYELVVPPEPAEILVGDYRPFRMPHDKQYEILAGGLGLDIDTVRAVATGYARDLLRHLPTPGAVRSALRAANVEHTYPTPGVAAARGAFGRVVSDFVDAGLLDDVPPHIARLLRTFDVDLVVQVPVPRPPVIPSPPAAGHDQTPTTWLAFSEERLAEYQEHATQDGAWVIGASSHMTVLNWNHLEEEVTCGTIVGSKPNGNIDPGNALRNTVNACLTDLGNVVESAVIRPGLELVETNHAWGFHQLEADWLAFRPDVAVLLGWTPDNDKPGRWLTATGAPAVETVRWVDGWPGRGGPMFDDFEADGYAVVLSRSGFNAIIDLVGAVTRVFVLTRWGVEDGSETERVRVTATDTAVNSST